eukprot:UN25946
MDYDDEKISEEPPSDNEETENPMNNQTIVVSHSAKSSIDTPLVAVDVNAVELKDKTNNKESSEKNKTEEESLMEIIGEDGIEDEELALLNSLIENDI